MTFLATTRVAILRGTTTSGLGDAVDDNTDDAIVTGYESLAASIIERSRQVFDPASGTRRTVRVVTGRVQANVALLEGDRVKDLGTGKVYALNEKITAPRTLAGQSSLILDLRDLASA